TDIFAVESEIAKAIADQLRVHLTGREEQVIAAKPTDNPEAYDAYLRGLAYTLKTQNTPANYLGAQKYLREAVRLDPKFALAWALLAYVDARGYHTTNIQPTVALRNEAQQAMETALGLDPSLGEAGIAKGAIAQAQGDLPRAASILAPLRPTAGDPTAWETLAYQAILERRPAEIVSRLKELLAKPDPDVGYLNGELRFWLGWAEEVAGDNDAARETWRQARAELEALFKDQSENWALLDDLALATASLGDKAAALALVERAIALNPIEKEAANG